MDLYYFLVCLVVSSPLLLAFHCAARQNGSIAVSGRRGHISVEIFLDSEAYSKLPANFADSPVIKVKACLFSSGKYLHQVWDLDTCRIEHVLLQV